MDPAEPRSEADRLLALRETGLLDAPPPAAFAGIVARARSRFGVATALVTLVDLAVLRVAADADGGGGGGGEIPRSDAFCDHAIRGDEVLVVPDLARDARFAANPLVVGPPFHRFYAGAPLIWLRGVRLGSLCLLDARPRDFTPGDRAELAALADEVVIAIAAADARRVLPFAR